MNWITFFDKKNITIANMCSFFAIILGIASLLLIIRWEYFIGFNFILLWVIFDMLDGYFARKYNTTSTFWKILDSFADMLLYVLSVVFLYFSIHSITLLGIIIVIGFLFTSIYRLAYFFEWGFMKKWDNIYYIWMPVYFHLILFQIILVSENAVLQWISFFIFSFLMISNLLFRKFWLSIGFGYILSLFVINNSISLWLF